MSRKSVQSDAGDADSANTAVDLMIEEMYKKLKLKDGDECPRFTKEDEEEHPLVQSSFRDLWAKHKLLPKDIAMGLTVVPSWDRADPDHFVAKAGFVPKCIKFASSHESTVERLRGSQDAALKRLNKHVQPVLAVQSLWDSDSDDETSLECKSDADRIEFAHDLEAMGRSSEQVHQLLRKWLSVADTMPCLPIYVHDRMREQAAGMFSC